jgi:protein-tyrosine phosphatase
MDELDIPRRPEPLMLTEEYARSADLILTAERHHRAVVAGRFPFAVRRTFTLLEFARLIAAGRRAVTSPVVRSPDDLLELARIGRSHVQPVDDTSIDIGDPVAARSVQAMTICSDTISRAVETIFGQ